MQSESKLDLAKSYDEDAARRAQSVKPRWKLEERDEFLSVLVQQGATTLLEIGAGTGEDSRFYKEHGYEVACIDLSKEMVRFCIERGLDAKVMDFYSLEFPDESFDSIYALNCLLHVPKNDIDHVLLQIKRVLKPDGIFYMGVYGGPDSEGIWENDWCEPKRLFSFYSDEALRARLRQHFDIVYFKSIALKPGDPHFQSVILRNVVPSA